MSRFIEEHAWFVLNAALVAGLIALGVVLQGSNTQPLAASLAQTASSSRQQVEAGVEIGTPTKTTITATATAAPVVPATKPPAQRPRIQGGELEDDD